VALITLTRGSLSTTFKLAEKLSAELDYNILHRETAIKHAEKYGINETGIGDAGFMEKQPPHFWDRYAAERKRYLIFLKAAIMDFMVKGDVIYCGHMGQFILSDLPGLLRIRIDASMKSRTEVLVSESKLSEDEARRRIADIDLKRQKWTRFLYDVDFNDPLHYDIILNRDKLTLDSMAAIISCAINKPEYEMDPQTVKVIRDVHLKSIVMATFAYSPRTRGMDLAVQCDSDRGYVRVSGIAPILGMGTWEGDIKKIALDIEGVSSVDVFR
jgi:cytidylate kinase